MKSWTEQIQNDPADDSGKRQRENDFSQNGKMAAPQILSAYNIAYDGKEL